jgi:hypothetical protein
MGSRGLRGLSLRRLILCRNRKWNDTAKDDAQEKIGNFRGRFQIHDRLALQGASEYSISRA